MRLDWIAERQTLMIIMIIAALIYVILVGTFLTYQWQQEQIKLSRREAIAECLSSRGHIGPGLACWYDAPVPKRPEEPTQ
jgi:hypothetical protein